MVLSTVARQSGSRPVPCQDGCVVLVPELSGAHVADRGGMAGTG